MSEREMKTLGSPWSFSFDNPQNPLCGSVRDVKGVLICYRAVVNETDRQIMSVLAAAPEMLAALRHALAVCEAEAEMRGENDTDDYAGGAAAPVAEMIRDVIAKAERAA